LLGMLFCSSVNIAIAGITVTGTSSPAAYTAGASNVFTFNVTLNYTGAEYVDRFSFVFPAGVTPTAFTPASGTGSCGSENGVASISGQTVAFRTAGVPATGSFAPTGCGAYGFPNPLNLVFTVTVYVPTDFTGALNVNLNSIGDGFLLPAGSVDNDVFSFTEPNPWSQNPNGVNCANGNSTAYNPGTGVWTVTSTNCFYGLDFTSDATAFAQRTLCDNGSITALVTSISGGLGWAGITMRESNAAGAKKVQLMTNLSDLSRREFRTSTNGAAYPQQFPSQNRYWLRITRTGNQFVMYVSPNGTTWYPAGAQTIVMGNCIEMGLVVTNYVPNSTVTATFANVTVTGNMLTRPVINTLEDQLADVDFSIVPNPTNGWIAIDLSAYQQRKVQMELYNIQGKLLRTLQIERNQAKEEVDLSTFANGMYLVRVRAEGLPDVTKRVVVNSNQ